MAARSVCSDSEQRVLATATHGEWLLFNDQRCLLFLSLFFSDKFFSRELIRNLFGDFFSLVNVMNLFGEFSHLGQVLLKYRAINNCQSLVILKCIRILSKNWGQSVKDDYWIQLDGGQWRSYRGAEVGQHPPDPPHLPTPALFSPW